MKFLHSLTGALLIGVMAWPAQAQFAKPEDAVKYRKNSLFVMQQHWARVGAMATGKVPFDAKQAQDNMDVVSTLAKLPWTAFGEGTDKGETRAKPEIWKESAKFKEASDKFQAEVAKVNAAAKTGNLDNLKTAFTSASGSCKACHDNFRKE
jgi:cytochrome c556